MEEKLFEYSNEEKLRECINKLRDVLNEMCCAIDEPETSSRKLLVSQQLDKLIVEYMYLKNTSK